MLLFIGLCSFNAKFLELNNSENSKITISITDELNKEIKLIRIDETLDLSIDYDEKNSLLLNSLVIDKINFNTVFIDENKAKYNTVCRLYKSKNEKFKLNCNILTKFNNEEQIVQLIDINFKYNEYNIEIKSKIKNLRVKQLNNKSLFNYSNKKINNLINSPKELIETSLKLNKLNEITNTQVIKIKYEDNKEEKIIGNKGILTIITDYNDNELNIFDSSDIENYKFNSVFMDNNTEFNYNATCRLWKPNNDKIRIFCKFDENLKNQNQSITFKDTNFTYKNYNIEIKSEIDNIKVKQIQKDISFLYSELQTINVIDEKEIYYIKFKIESYYNERLILYNLCLNTYVFEHYIIKNNELICTITKTKIKEILDFSGKTFFVGSINNVEKIYLLQSVLGIVFIYNNIQTQDIYFNITRLIDNIASTKEFIAYETNITNISNVITSYIKVQYNSTDINNGTICYVKKNEDMNLLFLCYMNDEGTYSLGKITGKFTFTNIQYNFILENAENYEQVYVSGKGNHIMSQYPYILDFTLNENINIEFSVGEANFSKGIRLIKDSNELQCENLQFIKRCLINRSYFIKNNDDNYYTYHVNHLNKLSIYYEASPFKVILEEIIIKIKYENNKNANIVGDGGTFVMISDYSDSKSNIFDISDIENYKFNSELIGDNESSYNVECRLWKPNNDNIKIFCRFDENSYFEKQTFIFKETYFIYKKYSIFIFRYTNI